MFGLLQAAQEKLTPEQLLRYRACYCGLCRCLKERFGQGARLTLTYDMTFLVLLLGSLYEPEERQGEDVCLLHPRSPRAWYISEATEYAADMNLALARFKCLDDWEDEGSPAALAQARLLEPACRRVCRSWPRQTAAMERSIRDLSLLEREKREDADEAAGLFGELMAEVLVLREDRWSGELRGMGRALGGFLYVADACLDLDGDALWGRYNPFRRYYGLPDNEKRFRDILKMLLGECLYWFDRLPLVQDGELLKNILCAGLWTAFDRKFSDKKEASDDPGPV